MPTISDQEAVLMIWASEHYAAYLKAKREATALAGDCRQVTKAGRTGNYEDEREREEGVNVFVYKSDAVQLSCSTEEAS